MATARTTIIAPETRSLVDSPHVVAVDRQVDECEVHRHCARRREERDGRHRRAPTGLRRAGGHPRRNPRCIRRRSRSGTRDQWPRPAPEARPGSTDDPVHDARQAIRVSVTAAFTGDDAEVTRLLYAVILGRYHRSNLRELLSYARSDSLRLRAYQPLLGVRGATARRPLTVAQIATVLIALRDGLHIRRLIEPAAVPNSLYGEVALALAIAALDTRHRHQLIDDDRRRPRDHGLSIRNARTAAPRQPEAGRHRHRRPRVHQAQLLPDQSQTPPGCRWTC